jgi:cell filamentation protein
MYEATAEPDCYPGSTVLKNKLGLRTQVELDKSEQFFVSQRAREPLPAGRLSHTHYRAIHRHLFQDVYRWAGRQRGIRISKNGSTFCYPEYIEREMRRLFGWLADENFLRDLDTETFAHQAAHFIAELNTIHPFERRMAGHKTSS